MGRGISGRAEPPRPGRTFTAMGETPKVPLSRRLRAFSGRACRSLGDRVEPGRIRFACGAMLAINLVLLAVTLATSGSGRTALSRVQGTDNAALGGDYAAFHNAGSLLNRYPPRRLYDLDLQARLFHELFPKITTDRTLYFTHPPFIAALL